jgi:hypothetical protein
MALPQLLLVRVLEMTLFLTLEVAFLLLYYSVLLKLWLLLLRSNARLVSHVQ